MDLSGANSISSSSLYFIRFYVFNSGSYHPSFVNAWRQYAENNESAEGEETSENEDPSVLPGDQLYLALQYEYGGQDFDSIQVREGFYLSIYLPG